MSLILPNDLRSVVAYGEFQNRSIAPCELRQIWATAYTLQVLLGDVWFNRHVLSENVVSRFFYPQQVAVEDRFKPQDRLVHLAEMLFNFQPVAGFEEYTRKLQTRDVETAVGELEGIELLFRKGVSFHFVSEQGVKGLDYDVEVEFESAVIPCEMKCKIESTKPTAETVRDVLSHARKQLPPDKPGIVFIKVPTDWIKEPNISRIVEKAIYRVFGNTGRIAAVILHWIEWIELVPQGIIRVTKVKDYKNNKSRIKLDAFLEKLHAETTEAKWLDYAHIVCSSRDTDHLEILGRMIGTVSETLGMPVKLAPDAIYQGNFDKLVLTQDKDIITRITFECADFEIFSGDPEAATADVTLSNYRIPCFSIARGETQFPFLFQFRIPGKLYNANLVTKDGNVIGIQKLPEIAQVESPSSNDLNNDEFLSKLRDLFNAMRRENDLTQPEYVLRNIEVSYWTVQNDELMCVVRYLQPIQV